MTTNTKGTAKSCGCRACRRGKGTQTGAITMKREERAARHHNKQALRADPEGAVIAPGHRGTYTD